MSSKFVLPKFVTFTGPDETIRADDLIDLHLMYDVEFGFLFSQSRQGTYENPRYPSLRYIEKTTEELANVQVPMAAHICGEYAKNIVAGINETRLDKFLHRFHRCQINVGPDVLIDTRAVAGWANQRGLQPILQTRDFFPHSQANVQYLFDVSGGEGKSPESWPEIPKHIPLAGYAGGIKPGNVEGVVEGIIKANIKTPFTVHRQYWIDMESGVRDDNDLFDVDKCFEVCGRIYNQ